LRRGRLRLGEVEEEAQRMGEAEHKAETHQRLGNTICGALVREIEKLDLLHEITPPRWRDARFALHRDPALGEESLEALWTNERGYRLGSITIHADGSFFAKYDIIRPHPHKAHWFIEAVSAWGRAGVLK
jgi:hypothetical protein